MRFLGITGRSLLLAGIGCASAGAAQVRVTVQPPPPYTAPPAPSYSPPPVPGRSAQSDLAGWLNLLASDPESLPALSGAGRAALELGDAQAALTFFGRAEALAPNDGAIKAGIGSSLVLMEQGATALQFFYEAYRLGVPASDMAGYRGLAYDLTGDPQRAQQDYYLSLRRREDPEVRRRLALSLAIVGQKDAALAAIDDQIRRQDSAAWRTRAFILALTGDTAGASRVVDMMMPGQSAAMAPFLARLPGLSVPDRALAVHFGHFPGDPVAHGAEAAAVPPPLAGAVTAAGQPDPRQPPLGAAPPVRIAVPPSAALSGTRTAQATAPPPPPPVAPRVTLAPSPNVPAPRVTVQAPPAAPVATIGPPSLPVTIAPPPAAVSVVTKPPPAPAPVMAPAPSPPSARPSALADISQIVATLKDVTPRPVPAKPATPARKVETPAEKYPARIWVQLASGANESRLDDEYHRIRGKAAKLFTARSGWIADNGATNRLLVGPFKSNKEAQDFVNQLQGADLGAFSWSSAAGQEIKKLPAR